MADHFYAVNNLSQPLAQLYTAARYAEYDAWLKLIPELEEDFELVSEQCARHYGQSVKVVTKTFLALQRLTNELPQLYAVIQKHWHLAFPRVIAIDTALSKLGNDAGEDIIQEIDCKIAHYLTPRLENQQLPSAKRISQRVRELVNEFDDRVPVKDPRPQRRMVKDKLTANSSSLAVEAPHEEIQRAEDCVKATADALGISRAEAMLQVLSGDTPAKDAVTKLVLFSAKDIENAPAFLQGFGWVGPETVERLREGATIIDADEAAHAETASYQPTDAIRTFVEGRDGTCRWPGCSVPAQNCQLDHRHNFDEGGPTSPSNLFALCQHHHNIKTDTRAMYIVDPISDVVFWLFEDGTWVSDTAQDGPIGKGAKNWLQTFEQKIAARRKNAQESAHELADAIDEYYKKRAEEDKREQDQRDIIDELWVDDVKLAQALLREGDFEGENPLMANDNVFALLEAIHKMGLDLDINDGIAPWARIQKKLLEHERAENERRILEEAEKLAHELAEEIMKQKEKGNEETEKSEESEEPAKVPTNPEDPPF
ncbi:HNH endonuclease signature motif containing protein [Corynebacterium sp. J010B-136]|uniref:HNH endonuclease signature motif containing protein n=1 Tax=Corynebacterium sp. J010B-136 TaxID=2099401 RepID=UPI000CF95AC0|nr:HNH endonuclease signature motif containing protein [Corynebacterium sp. J010B-136]PQM73549.1 restriction endonuclease [Corynebacterium sp. J010B-136]